MFEKGNLLKFKPFYFKNGAPAKDKFFVVLKNIDGKLVLASLPTSKDHVPSFMTVQHGCIQKPDAMINVFVFMAGEKVTDSFAFPLNTFIYASDLDEYPVSEFSRQIEAGETDVEVIGKIKTDSYSELIDCLKSSSTLKRKYRKIL